MSKLYEEQITDFLQPLQTTQTGRGRITNLEWLGAEGMRLRRQGKRIKVRELKGAFALFEITKGKRTGE